MNRVEEAIGFLVDFGDDARARALPLVALALAAQMEFLTHGEFFGEAQDAAVAADEQSLRGLFERGTAASDPRCLDGQAESHAVTLAEAVRNGGHHVFHEIAKFQTSMQISREPACETSFVVPSNNVSRAFWAALRAGEVLPFPRAWPFESSPMRGISGRITCVGNVLPLIIQRDGTGDLRPKRL